MTDWTWGDEILDDTDEKAAAEALMRDAKKYVRECFPRRIEGSEVNIIVTFLEHVLMEKEEENALAIKVAGRIIAGEV